MKTKKLLGIVLAFMLVIASMSTVFAASNQDVLSALEKGVTLSTGESFYISAQDMQTAKNYLAQENLSSSELDSILGCIQTTQEIAKTCDSLAELKADPDAVAAVNKAAEVAGVSVALNAGQIVITDSNGKVLVTATKDSVVTEKPNYSSVTGTDNSGSTQTSTSAIKQTGADINLTNMIIVISSAIVILAGASFVAFKFKLLKD